MVKARAGSEEHASWDAFVESSRAWRVNRGLREFLAAARETARATGEADGALAAHLDFAERKLDELDPVEPYAASAARRTLVGAFATGINRPGDVVSGLSLSPRPD